MLRGALIGCGFFAQNHLHAWRDVDGADIVAVCDRDQARLNTAGDKFGIAARYTDAAAMLTREQPDFVDIVTTMETHRALGELAAANGVPAICQKPFAPTIGDAEAIVAAFGAAKLPLMVHENFRWQTPLQAVKSALDSGVIGAPFFARVSWRTGFDVIANQPYLARVKRFIILDLGIHLLDVARFFFGEVTQLAAATAQVRPGIAGEDTATMLLRHRQGSTTVVDCTYSSKWQPDTFPETLVEIDGANGSLRLDAGFHLTVHITAGAERHYVGPRQLPWAEPPWHMVQESVLNTQQHWVDSLRAGTEPAPTGADNLRTMALMEGAYASAATGQTVSPAS